MKQFINETGKRYNRWLVVGFAGLTEKNSALFHTQCVCGEMGTVLGYMLRQGRSQSCGCLQRELAAKRLKEVGNYKESAQVRTQRMWDSGIRPRTWKQRTANATGVGLLDSHFTTVSLRSI